MRLERGYLQAFGRTFYISDNFDKRNDIHRLNTCVRYQFPQSVLDDVHDPIPSVVGRCFDPFMP